MRLEDRIGRGVLALTVVVGMAACGGPAEIDREDGNGSSVTGPSASATPAPAPTPTPDAGTPAAQPTPTPAPAAVAVAYNPDIKPILDADCVHCHGQFGSYAGTMAFVIPGSASSLLVQVTGPSGAMYGHLSGDRASKSDLIRRWVVDNGAAQSR